MKFSNFNEIFTFLGNSLKVLFSKIIDVEITPIQQGDPREITHSVKIFSKNDEIKRNYLDCFSYFINGVFEVFGFKEEKRIINDKLLDLDLRLNLDEKLQKKVSERILYKRKKIPRKKTAQERKILAVSKDLMEKLVGITKKYGVTLYSYLNTNVMQSAIFADKLKLPLKTIMREYEGFKLVSELDILFFPAPIWYAASKYGVRNLDWEQKWREFGTWAADYLKNRRKNLDLRTLTDLTRISFLQDEKKDARVELVQLHDEEYDFEFKIYGISIPKSVMQGTAALFDVITQKIGFKTTDWEITHGICILRLKKIK